MTERGIGNEAQARVVAEQIADAVITRWTQTHPEQVVPPKAEIPGILKVAGAIISAILTAGAVGVCFWIVSTLSSLQQTVTRIDERQKVVAESGDLRFTEIDRRVTALEIVRRQDRGMK